MRSFLQMVANWGKDQNGSISQEAFPLDRFGEFSIEEIRIERHDRNVPLDFPDLDDQAREKIRQETMKIILTGFDASIPVALAYNGTNVLTKLFVAPPVEKHKLVDIVKYEARQTIPFQLSDVEWRWMRVFEHLDHQYEDPFTQAEVAIAAIKKDAASRILAEAKSSGLNKNPDLLQFETLLLSDFLWSFYPEFQSLENRKACAFISMHGDHTRLVISNGNKLWQREIPVGGNHLTKAIARKEQRTFAAAERIKTDSESDGQSSEPAAEVIEELRTEIKRSLGFFNSISKRDGTRVENFLLLGGGFIHRPTEDAVRELMISEGCSELDLGCVSKHFPELETGNNAKVIIPPLMAALQRLGLGKFRMNFAPGGKVFGPKSKVAWGMSFGNREIVAVKVRVR